MRTASIHTRIQPSLKAKAEQIFAESGHTTSDVIEQLYIQTVRRGKVPIRLNRKRANIPDETLMAPSEIKSMINQAKKSARKQATSGELISIQNLKDVLREEHGINL